MRAVGSFSRTAPLPSCPPRGAMGYRKKKNKLARFVAMPWEVLDSPAWARLTNASKVAYVHLKRKITNANPGWLSLSYDEMEKHMNRHTFSRSLIQLEQEGFITKEQTGGLFRRRNFFKLSEEWRKSSSAIIATVDSANTATVKQVFDSLKALNSAKSGTCLKV